MIIPVAEVWRAIPGYPGYEASSLGNIRSFRSANGRGGLKTTPTPVKPTLIKGKPYYQVTLGKGDGTYYQARLHVLILETFIGPKPSVFHEGCHNDGNPDNNQESNLRWGTKADNEEDRRSHGKQIRGSKSPNTNLTEADVLDIRQGLAEGKTGVELSKKYQLGRSAISRIKNREAWGHI
ncbi:MAG: hypothetical protein [Bacteriophage sp.]|nr:MAG: hypothetical protein [Bacteriophage sp.]